MIGNLVEAREVLADHGRGRDAVTDVDDVEASLSEVDRFPPQLLRVQRPREVILADLLLVEAPAVVLVLLVAVPARGRSNAEVEVIATERRDRSLADAHDQEGRVVLRERSLESGDRGSVHRRFGQDHGVHGSCGGEQRAYDVSVEGDLGRELEEPETIGIHVLDRPHRRGPKIRCFDRERPWQEQDVVGAKVA